MPLRLDDKWVWDFWHVADGEKQHLFYLQAPRSLGDPDLRHWNASIRHAVSDDLRNWTMLPDALAAGPPGAWDDLAPWTGSVIEHDGRWWMFYTGTSRSDRGLVQRIGLASSEDLLSWQRFGDRPVLEADPEWYELLDPAAWTDQAWRDPWVWRDPADNLFHAYLAARARLGAPAERGVVGHATSRDLISWEVRPPITEPMGFGQMEVPQLVAVGEHTYLLFCGVLNGQNRPALKGTFALAAGGPHGPFAKSRLGVIDADPVGSFYAGKLIETSNGPVFLAWQQVDEHGAFAGTIADPCPVRQEPDGTLALVEEATRRR